MRMGITGTYSSGKTLTSLVIAYHYGLPRTEARTMREILPEAAPGKDLDECTSPQLVQMIVTRHTERAVHESRLGNSFVSDGCSLQEWIYGSVRVRYGVNPNQSVHLGPDESVEKTAELAYFEDIMSELGKLFKRHVRSSFDIFIHLPNELPLAADGHRPVNERFRSASDDLLKKTFEELGMRYEIVGGSLRERAEHIGKIIEKPPVMSIEDTILAAKRRYSEMLI